MPADTESLNKPRRSGEGSEEELSRVLTRWCCNFYRRRLTIRGLPLVCPQIGVNITIVERENECLSSYCSIRALKCPLQRDIMRPSASPAEHKLPTKMHVMHSRGKRQAPQTPTLLPAGRHLIGWSARGKGRPGVGKAGHGANFGEYSPKFGLQDY